MRMPTERRRLLKAVATSTRGLATELLDKIAKEKAGENVGEVDKSILGALGESFSFLANDGPTLIIT